MPDTTRLVEGVLIDQLHFFVVTWDGPNGFPRPVNALAAEKSICNDGGGAATSPQG
jgi:hypothetical protein